MPDVHAPHAAVRTWRDFFIHISTITIGLLIAIALEQCVEIPGETADIWVMNREQADVVADAAAAADSALRGLLWRTRWNLKFEEGIVRGAKNYDEVLINLASQNN